MSSNLDTELEQFLAEVNGERGDVSAAASDLDDADTLPTQRDVPIESAHDGHFAAPAPPGEDNPSAQNRGISVLGSESAQNLPSGHFSGHFAEVDGHFLPSADSDNIPSGGTHEAPADESAEVAEEEVQQSQDASEAPFPDTAVEDRMVPRGDDEEDTATPTGKGAAGVAWIRREVVDAKQDWFRSDAWRQGHPAVQTTVSYTREAGWAGDGRLLRGLAHAYNWTVGIPGQYIGIQIAHTVRRPARFLAVVSLLILTAWAVLTAVPANPLFDLTADLLRSTADLFDT